MLNNDQVKHIAGLARIGVDETEIEKISTDLTSILGWVEQLEKIDVSGVEPTAHISGIENVAREDGAHDFVDKDKIIKLFPERKDNYNKVKSVL